MLAGRELGWRPAGDFRAAFGDFVDHAMPGGQEIFAPLTFAYAFQVRGRTPDETLPDPDDLSDIEPVL
ncbi:MAG: hypothetical protein RLW68_01560 [Devosia marina]|uniref:hypothetical protein n=1 Tax=Devosia marina TaxID=2683198 RepID=UPI0032EF5812